MHELSLFEWLVLRYPLDVAARSQVLEAEALVRLPLTRELRILDLGAGTGANLVYYAPRLISGALWWLVDRDTVLLRALPPFRERVGADSRNSSCHEIHVLPGDFLDPNHPVYEMTFDLVLANAVVDLLSREQLDHLLELFERSWQRSPPLLLFTINLDLGLAFSPEPPGSFHWCRLYEQHMERVQPFGRALGAHAATHMEAVLRARGYDLYDKPSPWCITEDNHHALGAMLYYFERSISELIGSNPRELDTFVGWLADMRARASQGRLRLHVPHRDFLAMRGQL